MIKRKPLPSHNYLFLCVDEHEEKGLDIAFRNIKQRTEDIGILKKKVYI